MKNIYLICLVFLIASCTKDDKTFRLKSIKLNDYRQNNLPVQKLHLEVFGAEGATAIAHTDNYPSDLTLPATFAIHPTLPMTLYNKGYQIQLWGDLSGHIASCNVNMDTYKIIFPIDMEVKNDSLSVSIMGSWD